MNLNNIAIKAAVIYLYFPILIFAIVWLKLPFAILTVGVVCFLYIRLFFRRQFPTYRQSKRPLYIICLIVMGCLVILWCYLSGLGGYVIQTGDWQKHNVLLRDLVDMPWPVRYQMDGVNGVLTYYIGYYLIPAGIGKLAGFDAAEDALFILSVIGLFLGCFLISSSKKMADLHGVEIVLTVLALMLFATFISPVSGIYQIIFPEDVNGMADGVMWLSSSTLIQYSANTTLLRWVFSQFVPTFVASSLLVIFRKDYRYWGIIATPLILYSTFTFLGMAMYLFVLAGIDTYFERRNVLRKLLSVENAMIAVVAMMLLAYIASNIMQPKPDTAEMGFKWIDYSGKWTTLIAFQATWIIWIVLLSKKGARNREMWAASCCLFTFPFAQLGMWNDLCMRGSIPALLAICILVIQQLTNAVRDDKWYAILLTVMLVGVGMPLVHELYVNYESSDHSARNYNNPFETSEEYFRSYEFIKYQYVDWNCDNDIEKILLK